jgi:hypothetical protein
MKVNIFLAVVLLALGYVTCKNFQKTAEPTSPAMHPPAQPPSLGGHNAAFIIEGSNEDSAATRQVQGPPRWVDVPIDALPAPTASHKAFLSTGWWHVNMAISPVDTTIHRHYVDKYMKFREDQTFDIIYSGKVVDTGRWNWDTANNEIYLSCNDPYINNTWVVSDKGYLMIWKGNTKLNVSGIQIRVVGIRTAPGG